MFLFWDECSEKSLCTDVILSLACISYLKASESEWSNQIQKDSIDSKNAKSTWKY